MIDTKKISTFRQPTRRASRFLVYTLPLLYITLLMLASGLRFYKLDAQSFWNDEGNSARLSERSLPLIIEGTASDVHPPLYYVMLRSWREFLGESEFGLRSFSAFAGILTVAATIALARSLIPIGEQNSIIGISLFTGLLAAVNPTLVYYSQETRMYALLALISSLSALTLLCWLKNGRRWPWALSYVLLSMAGLYTHYFYPIMFIVQGIIVLTWFLRKYITLVFAPSSLTIEPKWSRVPLTWFFMVGMSFLLYLPWVPIFLRQTLGRTTEREAIPTFIWEVLRWITFGQTIAEEDLILVTVIIFFLLIWAMIIRGWRLIIPLFGVIFPVMAMYIAGTTNPAFFKFLLVAVPFFLIWLAGSLGSIGDISNGWTAQNVIPWILIVPVLIGMLFSLRNLYEDPAYARADYRAMAATIAAADGVNAAVILNAPNQWEVFTYYYQGDFPVYPLPKGQPDPQIIKPQLAEIASSYKRLYVLYWGDTQRDPQRVVENWLDENTFKASESWVGDVRFVIYATPAETGEQLMPVTINFGEKIFLHSIAINSDQPAPGDIIQLSLEWSADELLEDRYKVFIHLVDRDGIIVAQQDGEPVGGISPTTSWRPGEIIVDKHGVVLPDTITPGEYQLLLGLYEISDPSVRLPVGPPDEIQDYFELGPIVIK